MQTIYNSEMPKGVPGTQYDLSPSTIDSYACEGGNVKPGFGVVAGTNPEKQVKLPSSSVSTIKGVALYQAKEQDANGNVIFDDTDTVPVLAKGRVFVEVDRAVTADQAAYLIFSGANAGKWTNSAGAAAVAGARTYTVTTNFVATDTLVIEGVTYTFVASGATGDQINVGGSISATVTNIKTVLAADGDITDLFTVTNSGATFTLTETVPGAGNEPSIATTTGTGVISNGAVTESEAVDASAITGASFKITTAAAGISAVELK